MRALAIFVLATACGGSTPPTESPATAQIDCNDVAAKATRHATDTMPVIDAGKFTPAGPPPTPGDQVEPAHRIAGDPTMIPSDEVKIEIQQSLQHHIVMAVKFCVDEHGVPIALEFVKSSGYLTYDRHVCEVMRDWRYSPFRINQRPTPACTAVVLMYNQR